MERLIKGRLIKLTQGCATIVDEEDYELVSKYKWSTIKAKNGYYAGRGTEPRRMHRLIMRCVSGDGKIVDHRTGNGLNNRKYNLRVGDYSMNSRNCLKSKNNSSGKTGVYFEEAAQRFKAYVSIGSKQKSKNITKSFDINKHGYEEARNLACEWRNNKEKELGITSRESPKYIKGGQNNY